MVASRGIVSLPEVLNRFLTQAALRGEKRFARIRIVICSLAFANLLFAAGSADRLFSTGRYVVILGVIGLGAIFSAVMIRALRRDVPPARLLAASAAVDAILVTLVLIPSVLWPAHTWPGLVRLPHAFFFPIAIIASGLRLTQAAVLSASICGIGGALGLVCLDVARNPVARAVTRDDYSLFGIVLFIAVLLAHALSGRTRSLVREGGQALVDAERTRHRLGVYVSPEVADAVLATDAVQPGGKRQPVAVLFTDLRGFTAYSEGLPPERLVRELNAYLDSMVSVISEEKGVVDKYIGDAIMAVWGVPAPTPDDAARAIRTAWKLQEALRSHNKTRAAAGAPPLEQGIGVHFGSAVAGNIGTAERLQYTVIGEVVNLASRLESATKQADAGVILSRDVVEAAGVDADVPPVRPLEPIRLRGRTEPMHVMTFDIHAESPD